MQCLDDGIESLVAAEKAEDPDQLAPARDVIEHRKFLPGCRAPYPFSAAGVVQRNV